MPPGKWALGKVQVHPGQNGSVRVMTLKVDTCKGLKSNLYIPAECTQERQQSETKNEENEINRF